MHLSLVRILIAAADLGEGPGPHLTLGKNKEESQKEEKPAGKATHPLPPLSSRSGSTSGLLPPNFSRASHLDERSLTHEPTVE